MYYCRQDFRSNAEGHSFSGWISGLRLWKSHSCALQCAYNNEQLTSFDDRELGLTSHPLKVHVLLQARFSQQCRRSLIQRMDFGSPFMEEPLLRSTMRLQQ